MESTANSYTKTTESKPVEKLSTEGFVSKKALIGFLIGAAVVFTFAVYYCMTTNHVYEGGVLIGAFGLICVFAASVAKSFK